MTELEIRERIKKLEKERVIFLKEHNGVLAEGVLTKPLKITSKDDLKKYHQIIQEIEDLEKSLTEKNDKN